ncbi:MAG: Gfo/Idh/MocA family oxidoreductase, partial [Singulisphaera sp.]
MPISRRRMLGQSGATALAIALGANRARANRSAANVATIGIIGCGNQGGGLTKRFKATPDVRIAYVCDVDQARRDETRALAEAPEGVEDLRRILDDKSVDAVVIATPDHWHTPAAILAMEAGKHVYVEKPCCQNFREGVLLCEATRRTKRVLQHGTQFRSDPLALAVISAIRSGVIGEVLMSKAWNVQRRNSIGHEQPSAPPPNVNYDMWVGPAEFLPFQANRFHYNWRWWFNFGSGDMGNDGIHELDLARWGLGVDSLPVTVSGVGGKYYFDDDQQFPDTMTVAFEYAGVSGSAPRTLLYEQRLWSTNYPYNVDSGVEFYGTKGRVFVSKRGKLEVRGERNAPLELPQKPDASVPTHYQDFVDAIRSGGTPHADVETAFQTAALSHLGNISVRLGRS